jgi:hypothetical protein
MEVQMKFLKNKKVIAALVALALALVGVGLGVDLGDGAGSAATDAICQAITCE